VNQFKKNRLPGKVLCTVKFLVLKVFCKLMGWINMMMDEEDEDESNLNQLKIFIEGLSCF
jgi:hypothetical protein